MTGWRHALLENDHQGLRQLQDLVASGPCTSRAPASQSIASSVTESRSWGPVPILGPARRARRRLPAGLRADPALGRLRRGAGLRQDHVAVVLRRRARPVAAGGGRRGGLRDRRSTGERRARSMRALRPRGRRPLPHRHDLVGRCRRRSVGLKGRAPVHGQHVRGSWLRRPPPRISRTRRRGRGAGHRIRVLLVGPRHLDAAAARRRRRAGVVGRRRPHGLSRPARLLAVRGRRRPRPPVAGGARAALVLRRRAGRGGRGRRRRGAALGRPGGGRRAGGRPGVHRRDGAGGRLVRRRRADGLHLAGHRLRRAPRHLVPARRRLRRGVPSPEPRRGLGRGLGPRLRLLLVGAGTHHLAAGVPGRDAPVEPGRGVGGLPLADRPPGLRRRPRRHLLSGWRPATALGG